MFEIVWSIVVIFALTFIALVALSARPIAERVSQQQGREPTYRAYRARLAVTRRHHRSAQ